MFPLLSIVFVGLVLACDTAYAGRIPVSNVVDDSITNWVIGIFAIIIGMFITMIIIEAKKNGRK